MTKVQVLAGWGNYPTVQAEQYAVSSIPELESRFHCGESILMRGLGRSYGDSALNERVLLTPRLRRLIGFDQQRGELTCEAGVSLSEILEFALPRGWFLAVTPGTKYVTVGGAIACDVHGKSHHVHGSFCDHVISIEVLLPDGSIVRTRREDNDQLFRATCGGMGLSGCILTATIRLRRVETAYIRQRVHRAKNLEEILDLFDQTATSTYSVAWIDCYSTGKRMGRSVLLTGEHATAGDMPPGQSPSSLLNLPKQRKALVPIFFPGFVLNRFSMKAFNYLYYHRYPAGGREDVVNLDAFFYPLDHVHHWNRIYGRRGFIQYQFVLPKAAGREGLREILGRTSEYGKGSFLAVLKLLGRGNDNLLSFPLEGYTLALDFPMGRNLITFLTDLDRIVLHHGGRFYLAKDARLSPTVFREGYSQLDLFMEIRQRLDPHQRLQSLQARRLELV